MLEFLLNLAVVTAAAHAASSFAAYHEMVAKHDIKLRAEFPEVAEEGWI